MYQSHLANIIVVNISAPILVAIRKLFRSQKFAAYSGACLSHYLKSSTHLLIVKAYLLRFFSLSFLEIWGRKRMKLLLKFEMEDIRLAFTTKCYTPGVWQSETNTSTLEGRTARS